MKKLWNFLAEPWRTYTPIHLDWWLKEPTDEEGGWVVEKYGANLIKTPRQAMKEQAQ